MRAKEAPEGWKHCFMSGVGNSTISTDCFIKRGFIQRVVDGNREKGY